MKREDRPPERHRRVAEPECDDVNGEEAAAVCAGRHAVRERSDRHGCDRSERCELGRHAGKRARGDEAECDPDHEAEAELTRKERRHVARAVAAVLDPGDEAERERDGGRVVQSRLGGKERREPAPKPREAERREDGSRIGRADDGAEQKRLRPREVEQEVRGDAGHAHGHDDADRAEQEGRADHGARRRATPSSARPRRGLRSGRRCRSSGRAAASSK